MHLVMPAAALDEGRKLWRTKCAKTGKGAGNQSSAKPYLFNHKTLAKVFAAKLLAAIKQEGLALPARLCTLKNCSRELIR